MFASLRLRRTSYSVNVVHAVRITLRTNASLPGPFRELLYAPLGSVPASPSVSSYTDGEFRAIRRAARMEIRAALTRIRAGEAELTAWLRAPDPLQINPDVAKRGALLATIAHDGEIPHTKGEPGSHHAGIPDSDALIRSLFPSNSEIAAILVLLQCLTGHTHISNR